MLTSIKNHLVLNFNNRLKNWFKLKKDGITDRDEIKAIDATNILEKKVFLKYIDSLFKTIVWETANPDKPTSLDSMNAILRQYFVMLK